MAQSRTVYEKTRFRRQKKLSFLSVANQASQARKSVDSWNRVITYELLFAHGIRLPTLARIGLSARTRPLPSAPQRIPGDR